MIDKILANHEYEYLELCRKIMKYDLKVTIPNDLWYSRDTVTDYVHRKNSKDSKYTELIKRAKFLEPLINSKYHQPFTTHSPINLHQDEIKMEQWISVAIGYIKVKYSFIRFICNKYKSILSLIKDFYNKFTANNTLMILSVIMLIMIVTFNYFPTFYKEMKPIVSELISNK